MAEEWIKFEIGFRGGSTTGGRVTADEWAKLQAAFTSGGGTVEIAGDDDRWWLRLDDVAYLRRHDKGGRPAAGFGL